MLGEARINSHVRVSEQGGFYMDFLPARYVPGYAPPGAQAHPSVGTARTYALVGFIFYLLSVIGSVFAWFFLLFALPAGAFAFALFFPVFLGIIALVHIGLTVWAWMTLRNIEEGRYAEARTASLVLGIIGLFLAGVIGGVFFILAHSKLGEIAQPSPALMSRHCVKCGRAVFWDAKFCSSCGSELPP